MKIQTIPSFSYKTKIFQINNVNYSYPNDTVSFSAMKKSAFAGIDLACVNLFKLPIEKFNSFDDFKSYVSSMLENLYSQDFLCKNYPIFEDREAYLSSWKAELSSPKYSSNPTLPLIVYSSITKDLDYDNENMPPLFIQTVFNKTVADMNSRFSKNAKSGYDFAKNYNLNLKRFFGIPKNGWVKIPSFLNDQVNSNFNFQKLKVISLPSWCTKNQKAEEYLYKNNFHIYIENDETKVCIKEQNGNISEIQGCKNNSKIPLDYVETVKSYVDDNDLYDTSSILINSIADKKERDDILSELSSEIIDFDRKAIFKHFGIDFIENDDGTYALSYYHQPSKNVTYKDLGIDEKKLFEGVSFIQNDAFFADSSLLDLGELREVGGFCSLKDSQLQSTGKLEKVGSLLASSKSLKEIPNLRIVDGNADFSSSSLKSLNHLQIVNGDLFLKGCEVEDLGELKSVFGDFYGWKNSLKHNLFLIVHGEKR